MASDLQVDSGTTLRLSVAATPPLVRNTAPAAQMPQQIGLKGQRGTGMRRTRKKQDSSQFGPAYMPLKRVSGQSRYSTRSRALPHGPEGAACFEQATQAKQEDISQSTDALHILAEAAMLELLC